MVEKRQSVTKHKPVHQIRSGECTASIFQRQSNSGYNYYDYVLTRNWSSRNTSRQAAGSTFFEHHERDLVDVIQKATAWLRDKMQRTCVEETPNDQAEAAQ
jgi:transcriptional regulator of heat shock response